MGRSMSREMEIDSEQVEALLPAMDGKHCFITGCNSGLGLYCVTAMLMGGATVTMACRNRERMEAAAAQARSVLTDEEAKGRLHLVQLDLDARSKIAQAVEDFEQLGLPKIDVLMLNAAIRFGPYELTQDGFESHFGTNFLGHYTLTMKLLPKLSPTARVVCVTSAAHKKAGAFDLSDLNWSRRNYSPLTAYGESKLAVLLFARELNRRLRESGRSIRAYACHPGLVANAGQFTNVFVVARWLVNRLGFGGSVAKGATSLLMAGFDNIDPEGTGGQYVEKTQVTDGISDRARDQALGQYLFDLAGDLTLERMR